MQLTLLVITALAAFTSAVNVRGYVGYGCTGQQWICANIASGTCCKFPVNIRSMFWSIPSKAYYPSIHLQTLANLYEVAALDITASFATVLSIPPSAALLTLAGITHLQRTVSASPHP